MTDAPTLTKKIGAKIDADRADFVLDGVELVGAREDDAGREGADDEGRPGQRGHRRQAQRKGDREHEEHVAHAHPDDDVEQARHHEAADQHRDDQEAGRHRSVAGCPAA